MWCIWLINIHHISFNATIAQVNSIFKNRLVRLIIDYVGINESLEEGLKNIKTWINHNTIIDTDKFVNLLMNYDVIELSEDKC